MPRPQSFLRFRRRHKLPKVWRPYQQRRRLPRMSLNRSEKRMVAGTFIVAFVGFLALSSNDPSSWLKLLINPSGPYPSCRAARLAGSGPVYRGAPRYGEHLDADGDGIGCEWNAR